VANNDKRTSLLHHAAVEQLYKTDPAVVYDFL